MSFEIKKIHDPKFFKENCMAAHSDHVAYADEKEAEERKSSFRLPLDGVWKFHYANEIMRRPSVGLRQKVLIAKLGWISVYRRISRWRAMISAVCKHSVPVGWKGRCVARRMCRVNLIRWQAM